MTRFAYVLLALFLASCGDAGDQRRPSPLEMKSPMGIYVTNSPNHYWLVLMEEGRYMLCSPSACEEGNYTTKTRTFVILHDFFKLDIAYPLEEEAHPGYADAIRKLREGVSPLFNDDFPFNIGMCENTPCVQFGDFAEGIKFMLVQSFS